MTDWTDAPGAITAYPDIPSEYLTGIANGRLGDWLQEVHDAEYDIEIMANCAVIASTYEGRDDDTHRVDIMLVRAFLAWKGREG